MTKLLKRYESRAKKLPLEYQEARKEIKAATFRSNRTKTHANS